MIFLGRFTKRIVIAVIVLAVLGLGGYWLKKAATPAPTCADKIKNGQEEGIDCGLIACNVSCEEEIASPQVKSGKFMKVGKNDYDFVAQIANPHDQYGASEVNYELIFFDQNDAEALKKEGIFYLLPAQETFLVLTSLNTEENIQRFDLRIKSAKWQKLESSEEINLAVKREKLSVSPDGLSNILEAVVFNGSDFDFGEVDIQVLILGAGDDIVAVNKTMVRTLVAGTERYFKVVWSFPISGRAAKIEIRTTTNLFENANFVKRYGSPVEKFQKYD